MQEKCRTCIFLVSLKENVNILTLSAYIIYVQKINVKLFFYFDKKSKKVKKIVDIVEYICYIINALEKKDAKKEKVL